MGQDLKMAYQLRLARLLAKDELAIRMAVAIVPTLIGVSPLNQPPRAEAPPLPPFGMGPWQLAS